MESIFPAYKEFNQRGGGTGGPGANVVAGWPTCFTGETKVHTENGLLDISEIKAGMKVYSYNFDANSLELMMVTKSFQRYSEHIYEITCGNFSINATAEHPFYIIDKGWVKVKDLQEGDLLKTSESDEISIVSVKKYYRKEKVFNIEVQGNHNYFVSEKKVLVHNKNQDK